MAIEVIMPQLGESVVEGTITKWLKAVGEAVEEYEALLEVNTDKVDTEVPSPASGVMLARLVEEGTVVRAGTVLAWIGMRGENIPARNALASTEKILPVPEEPDAVQEVGEAGQPAVQKPGERRDLGFISPVVKRIAAEYSVDLYQVQGSGEGGRITKKDVLAYIEEGQIGRTRRSAPTVAHPVVTTSTPTAASTPAGMPPATPAAIPEELIRLTPVRRAIAEHMVLSKHTSPHVTTVMEADLSRVVAHRQANKAAFERDGANLTYTVYFAAAAVETLKAYPLVNSSWSEEGILLHRQINLGMATSLGEEGLIVPVIKQAETLSLLGLARAINDLAGRARLKKLQPDEVRGGTFTITNHGITGSLFATPVINQPQCAILGVGAIQKRAVVISDAALGDVIAIRPMVYLSLTFDHRILDGAAGDHYLGKVVELLENWS
jgi:pyruvate/2-oxoglutarate dehydrogenase complex dihydrolipoamide acyltransferase (E2) component